MDLDPELIKRQRNWLRGKAQRIDSVDLLTHIIEDERVRREKSAPPQQVAHALL